MSNMDFQILNNINHRLYAGNKQANEIWGATQPELDDLAAEVHRIHRNTRANLADARGIGFSERDYGILPNLIQDTPEDRRERVLEAKRAMPPFTTAWLNQELAKRAYSVGGAPDSMRAYLEGLGLILVYDALPDAMRTHRELMPWIRGIIPVNLMVFASVILPRAYIKRPRKIMAAAAFAPGGAQIVGRPAPRNFVNNVKRPRKILATGMYFTQSGIFSRPVEPNTLL